MKSSTIYKIKSNYLSSYSIKEKFNDSYIVLRDALSQTNLSVGEYIVGSFIENYEGLPPAELSRELKKLKWLK
tara:strand:- start:173 stop:391 length:219 start_codon:yes stop_codon:yes gene_type:complete